VGGGGGGGGVGVHDNSGMKGECCDSAGEGVCKDNLEGDAGVWSGMEGVEAAAAHFASARARCKYVVTPGAPRQFA